MATKATWGEKHHVRSNISPQMKKPSSKIQTTPSGFLLTKICLRHCMPPSFLRYFHRCWISTHVLKSKKPKKSSLDSPTQKTSCTIWLWEAKQWANLFDIKSKVDLITAAQTHITREDIIYYTVNGLPLSYQGFKIAICTNLQSISLDDLYSLLWSEETMQLAKVTRQEINT